MSQKSPTISIKDLPYSRRQLIIVQPDVVVAASREAEANAVASSVSNEGTLVDIVGKITKSMVYTQSAVVVFADLASEALTAWAKARASGLNVLQIGHTEAKELQFPPGHPRDQAMYVAHPAVPTVYYTAASFHRMVFEHKFAEAVRLLMNLGASKITVEHVHGWSNEFSTNISVGLPEGEGGASAGKKGSASSKLLFEALLKNQEAPRLPSDLVWYHHEAAWQAVADGRLKHGMQQFSLNVIYEDDFGVNAGLKMKAQKVGLDMGGAFEDHMATTWKIHGVFAAEVP